MQDQTAPLVSVVMPAYNADKYIEAAVRSVQTQTFPDWELILVDDCSTDGTADRICALAAEDGRLRPVFSAENHGAAESRNLAFSYCRGDYVALLDADDLWRPEKLVRQLLLAEETGADILYCSYGMIDEAGRKAYPDFIVGPSTDFDGMLIRSELSCSTVLLRRELAETHPFETGFYHEDYAYWLRLLRDGFSASGTPEVLADYRVSKNSRSNNKWKSAVHRWEIYRTYLGLDLGTSLRAMSGYAVGGVKKYSAKGNDRRGAL